MKNGFSIFLILSFLALSCSDKTNNPGLKATSDSVEVFTLKKDAVAKSLVLPAELYPWERAEIYAKVQGYVKELRVDIGDKVKKNDILVIIDAPEVTANYASALADLQTAEARFKTATDTYQRTKNASGEQGTVSDNELVRARNQMVSDSGVYVAAQSRANAYAQLKNYLVIHSAFDGVITQRNIDPGALVGANSKPMFVLENLNKLRLRVAIPEIYTSTVPDSSVISFTVDAMPSKIYKAALTRKSNVIDLKTRTELWEFDANNENLELKSGMYGTASFKLHRNELSFVIPFSSLVTNLERNFVIRVNAGKTEWVDVRTGITLKDNVEIFGDLQAGDALILKASDELKMGTPVVTKGQR